MNTSRALRCSIIAFGAVLLVSVGTAAASADETNMGDQDIDVNVEITEIEEPGVLALTVAGSASTQLTENGSTELVRQFTGTLPTVTVTDTRTEEEIPAGASWYVLGSASDFTGPGETTITADHLGWTPALVEGAGEGEPFISVGGDVLGTEDGGLGLGNVEKELLFLGDSAEAASGAWSATAGLQLKVGADVEPGSYASVVTLSLFE
ncbi:hypothetical protein DEA06_07655 [Microbacterium sp. Gd 4-13]|uniref:hypothetical protein n=1 Tax=Microbacterium sp. Gd 4-13 TaxID=2173179 RepID=UPI000D564218|nr:hypothetical protein [Microbacterium sp. Gd 4-13]PVW04650.1 hypothetical protein DEA06_07655 [Microbacterium sp. Gd 4-13]